MALKRTERFEEGYVFETKGSSIKDIRTEELKDRDFDPHFVTLKIIEFGKILTGLSLYSYQEAIAYRIIYSVVTFEGLVLTVLLSRQSGKSEVMAFVIDTLTVLLPALAKVIPDLEQFGAGFRVGLFAPQSDQVNTTYSRAMTRLDSANAEIILADPDINTYLDSTARLSLSNGSSLTGQVASKQSKIESKTYDLVIVEEAQDVDDFIVTKSIEPMISACVCAGSLVWDIKGNLVPIEKHKKANGILGYDGNGCSIEPISYWQDPQKKICFRITTNTGRYLECSEDHPILFRERKGGMYGRKSFFKEAKDFKIGDQLFVIEEVQFWGVEEMWEPRLVGWLVGDGSYGKDSTPVLSTCDKEIYSYVKDNFDYRLEKGPRLTSELKMYQEIAIKGICKELRYLQIYGQTKLAKRLPKDLGKFSKQSIAEMLGGFFDTDGHITLTHRRGNICLSSYCYELLNEVRFALQKFGVHCGIFLKHASETSFGTEDYYVLTISDKRSIKAFKEQIKFSVKYKQNKLESLCKILDSHKEKIPKEITGARLERVVSVENIGEQYVYNLTADNTHTYMANGIITHNTGGTIIKVGTTGQSKNHFWYEILNNRNNDRKIKNPNLRTHFEYDYKSIIAARKEQFEVDGKKFHLNYENDILRKKQRWGEDSQSFKLAYALIWDLESGMLITDKDWDKIVNRKKGFSEVTSKDYIVAGLDIARSPASTILTFGKVTYGEDIFEKPYKEIVGWLDLGGLDYEAQHHYIMDALVQFEVKTLYADYTGVGISVVDRLMYACGEYVDIVPYPFTSQSKSEMWYNFISDITTKRLIVPANKVVRGTQEFINFEEQMKNCQKYFNGSYLVCEKSDGYFDDYVDSAALMCLAANSEKQAEYEVEESENPLFSTVEARRRMERNNYLV